MIPDPRAIRLQKRLEVVEGCSRRNGAVGDTRMLWTGRIAGAIVGFAVGVYFAEVVFANTSDWTNVVPLVLAVVGWLAGSEIGRQLASRPANS